MRNVRALFIVVVLGIVMLSPAAGNSPAQAQRPERQSRLPKTPLSQEILDMLANEISGQMIFNNEVRLCGAPWLRSEKELKEGFYESETLAGIARSYGIADVRIERFPRDGEFEYAVKGEFWTLKPQKRLIARLEADAAMIAGVPPELDISSGLVYIPPLTGPQIKEWTEGVPRENCKGKIALMWSHANQNTAKALDAAGIAGVISFSSRERYFDPDQVVYSRGSYRDLENLKFGLTVSWRQWSELLEDVESGREVEVRAVARTERYPDRFENVLCSIPGTEPGKRGVIFTAHLFEGFTKRGANDDMSGVVVQLEIARALTKLIAEGALPKPRRTITFLWPPEISGTYEQIRRTPDLIAGKSININMDMVGEWLRKNNAVFTMSECPNHLPSYLDGLADSVMNYVWRTNDIVYLPDSPRGRPGGQYLPLPLREKNGSLDAFRYFTHAATGGSDHICFNNPSVAIPGIEFFTWPDQWYHADTDTPDKSDPTQMKRVAFIGAAAAWAVADCNDEVLAGLLEAVSAFGYARVGKRELPRALQMIADAGAEDLQRALDRAINLSGFAADREGRAVKSVEEIYSGSRKAREILALYAKQWDLYKVAIARQVTESAAFRAAQLGVTAPMPSPLPAEEQRVASVTPSLQSDVKLKEFSLEGSDRYKKYVEANPQALKELKITAAQSRAVLNFIDGRRTLPVIRRSAEAETGTDIDFREFLRFIDFLKAVDWIVLGDGAGKEVLPAVPPV